MYIFIHFSKFNHVSLNCHQGYLVGSRYNKENGVSERQKKGYEHCQLFFYGEKNWPWFRCVEYRREGSNKNRTWIILLYCITVMAGVAVRASMLFLLTSTKGLCKNHGKIQLFLGPHILKCILTYSKASFITSLQSTSSVSFFSLV